MKSMIVVALALVAIAVAAPTDSKPDIQILSYKSETNPDGSYTFAYESEDGSSRLETGIVKETVDEDNKPVKVIVVSGSYTFLDAEGKPDTITYSADENGFRADGKSIPKVVSRR